MNRNDAAVIFHAQTRRRGRQTRGCMTTHRRYKPDNFVLHKRRRFEPLLTLRLREPLLNYLVEQAALKPTHHREDEGVAPSGKGK